MVRLTIIVSIPCVMLALLAASLHAVPPAPWEIDEIVGQNAPAFTLKDMNDREVSLKDFRGKVLFINFWATWCPPCKEEVPSLNKLHQKYVGKDFAVVGISTDGSKKAIVKFIKKYNVQYVILHDRDSKTMRKYKGFSLPVSFLIDREGRIYERFLGAEDWTEEEFLRKIESLM